jgi:hypothetical protein
VDSHASYLRRDAAAVTPLDRIRKAASSSWGPTGMSASSHQVRIRAARSRGTWPRLGSARRGSPMPPRAAPRRGPSAPARGCRRTSGQPPRRLISARYRSACAAAWRKLSRLGEAFAEPGSASVAFAEKASRISSSKLEGNRSSLSRKCAERRTADVRALDDLLDRHAVVPLLRLSSSSAWRSECRVRRTRRSTRRSYPPPPPDPFSKRQSLHRAGGGADTLITEPAVPPSPVRWVLCQGRGQRVGFPGVRVGCPGGRWRRFSWFGAWRSSW